MKRNKLPIGVFDSGVGGISTLAKLRDILPNEDFVFYGDSCNAPYGGKTKEEILRLSENVTKKLVDKNVKAIVIACNTATSAAKKELEKKYPNIPIVGIEPALKEAVDKGNKHILVMGTELTLKLEKFNNLLHNYEKDIDIKLLACPGLVDVIEKNINDKVAIKDVLSKLLKNIDTNNVEAVVLGCTHYKFVENEIKELINSDVKFYTGYEGVAKQLKNILDKNNLLNREEKKGCIIFNSTDDKKNKIDNYEKYYNLIKK